MMLDMKILPLCHGMMLSLLLMSVGGFAQTSIQYIGNMGVLISTPKAQILIDALHEEYDPDYLFPPQNLIDSLRRRIPPYHNIGCLLVSHRHRDHFSKRLTQRFLNENPTTVLFTHAQIADSLPSKAQLVVFDKYNPRPLQLQNVQITPMFLRHTWQARHQKTDNFGYLIQIDTFRVLHLGDAEYEVEDFERQRSILKNIDVAIVPTWFAVFEEGKAILKKYINPKTVVVTHISPLEKMIAAHKLQKNMISFYRIGQRINLPP